MPASPGGDAMATTLSIPIGSAEIISVPLPGLFPQRADRVENDHLTLAVRDALHDALSQPEMVDIAAATMTSRMIKSDEEIRLITAGANVADIGGAAVRDAIRTGTREIDVAMAGRDAMELAIAERYPDSELRDTWVWFQSGINTDGAHNPVTVGRLSRGCALAQRFSDDQRLLYRA